MRVILLLLSLASALVATSSSDCHSCFSGVCYRRSKLFGSYAISGQLAIDRSQNIVYYHFANNQTNKDYTYLYNLEDVFYSEIPGVSFTFARAVDQNTRDVYMSGTKGVYKYSPNSNSTVLVGLADKTIWHMQYANKLYYNVYAQQGLYTFENRRSTPIPALSSYKIDDFVVDKMGDIYFLSGIAIYRYKHGISPMKLRDGVYSMATDRNGQVYFAQSSTNGIYKIDYNNYKIVDVGAFGDGTPLHFVFDRSNKVVYHDTDSDALYYLHPTYGRCKVRTRKTGGEGKLMVTFTHESQNNGIIAEPLLQDTLTEN